MAQVTITANARIRDGILTHEDNRTTLLKLWGKNDHLLRDTERLFRAGITTEVGRVGELNSGREVYTKLVFNKDLCIVGMYVYNLQGELLGTAVFGVTSFFSCVHAVDSDIEI